ncbi:MAG TPA: plastocyanin/azurin family copper-binding protein [Acidimicrobiia bacterium]
MTEGTITDGDEDVADDAPVDEATDESPDETSADDSTSAAASDAGDTGGTTPPELASAEHPEEPLKDRLILPLLIPWLAIAAVALVTLNLSRVFLAGDSTSALVIAALITVGILLGAAGLSAAPGARTSTLALFIGLCLVILVSAGMISIGPSLENKEAETTGPTAPTGPAVASVTIDAGPGLSFNGVKFTNNYTADKSGIIQVNYGGDPGHTLVFQDPKLSYFELQTSGKKTGKVELKPGKYTVYCNVPGHEAAGMRATITVP